ncbi:MAG: M56 family metallopeptidase [Clostridia bacterium]|nr:M56 family metallopeptidase [Clostridia bacterium]MBR6645900.1 M56 family metallopeptidase [Clostridia bacterium]
MLNNIFQTIIEMNITAICVAALILPVKFILQKVGFSRRHLFVLWAVIAFRLISPVAPAADISIFNSVPQNNEIVQSEYYLIPAFEQSDEVTYNTTEYKNENTRTDIIPVIWLCGASAMFIYGIASYFMLKKKVRFAVKLKENVYTSESVNNSFVFGIFKPKIFIPENIDGEDLDNIIIHEQTHIKRLDHIAKMIAYLILSVHWFNPFNWLLFKLFAEDAELSCDENVCAKIGEFGKNSYLNTLLQFSVNRKRIVTFYNVGFSLNATKRRIKNMISMKKSSKIMSMATICICILIACTTVTNAVIPVEKATDKVSVILEDFTEEIPVFKTEAPAEKELISEPLEETEVHNNNANIPADIPEETIKIKSSETFDKEYIGIEQIEFPAGTKIPEVILKELKKKGIRESDSGTANLTRSYLKDDYNTKDNYYEKINGVTCDENGNISFYMELNSGNFMDVTITDSETGKQVIGFGMLAGGKSAHTLLGFDKNKSYNIEIKSVTDDEWNLEGHYIIY